MFECEMCNTWQHGKCVNYTEFTKPLHYICPTCRQYDLSCPCGKQKDYKKSLVMCSKCKKYFHKRHVQLGIGEIPKGWMCPTCCPKETWISKIPTVVYIPSILPGLNISIKLKPVTSVKPAIPEGLLFNLLSSAPAQTSVCSLAAHLYSGLRGPLFQSHTSIVDFHQKAPMADRAASATDLLGNVVNAIAQMCSVTPREALLALDHAANLDVYKAPGPAIRSGDIGDDPEHPEEHCEFSQRAEEHLDRMKNIPRFRPRTGPRMALAPGPCGHKTAVALDNLRAGDFICFVYGNVMLSEEFDRESVAPTHAAFRVAGTRLVVDAGGVSRAAPFRHIRRGLVANAEIRVFECADETLFGVFASGWAATTQLATRTRPPGGTIARGEEIVLPIDAPTVVRPEPWARSPAPSPLSAAEMAPPRPDDATLAEALAAASAGAATAGSRRQREGGRAEPPASPLRALFGGGPVVACIDVAGEDPEAPEEPLPAVHARVARFPPPGKKAWRRVDREPERQLSIPPRWFAPPQRPPARRPAPRRPPPADFWRVDDAGDFVHATL